MKSALIIFLIVVVVVLGYRGSLLQKELLSVRGSAAFYEKRSDDLQRELMRMSSLYREEERILDGIEENIAELENKINLETLERYIPKKTWDEIKPVVDRLQSFGKEREKSRLSGDQDD
ncbi:MAG: hypothetical protein Q8N62_02900 [Candidatus Omnitrophota bacterium]|nr:hypothetical protein [Candidatus Omnitrophota bacterium]